MGRREYVCGECGHHFGTPEGEAVNARALMCPSCGSIDLSIAAAAPAPVIVMRATQPARAGDSWRRSDSEAS